MDERRQYVRSKARLQVIYTVPPRTRRLESTTTDVGAGGIRFVANESLPLGTRLQCELTLPGKPPIPFTGEVVSSDEYKASSTLQRAASFEIGVRIVGISPADREVLKRYVSVSL